MARLLIGKAINKNPDIRDIDVEGKDHGRDTSTEAHPRKRQNFPVFKGA